VPGSYGGLTFKDNNTLLLGGSANTTSAKIYALDVVRDAGGHITGFGTTTFFSNAPGLSGGGIDGGLIFAPNGDLLYTSYSDNSIGQIKPGSTSPDKQTNLTSLGFSPGSVGTLAIAPNGTLKILSYSGAKWWSTSLTPDGTGTYKIAAPSVTLAFTGGPEGLVYVPANSPVFAAGSILVSEYSGGAVSVYQTDANGDPISGTRQVFLNGFGGAEGATIDPVTGDFLFSTFGSNNLYRVSGFAAPVTGTPEPGTWSLLSSGALLLGVASLRFGKS